jgi:REP element-mobilizing transposase RayT
VPFTTQPRARARGLQRRRAVRQRSTTQPRARARGLRWRWFARHPAGLRLAAEWGNGAGRRVSAPPPSPGRKPSTHSAPGASLPPTQPRARARGQYGQNTVYLYTSRMRHEIGSVIRPDPVAFFVTWTTYASWLPGDQRGWHARPGVYRRAHSGLARTMAERLRHAPIVLSLEQRDVVERAISEHCAFRGWHLLASSCRTNHVHVVVSAVDRSAENISGDLKSRSSRQLSEFTGTKRRWWTKGSCVRQIYTSEELERVVAYVLECQDKPRT